VIWVTEVWRSQADLDASLERIRGSEDVAATMSPVDDWEMIAGFAQMSRVRAANVGGPASA